MASRAEQKAAARAQREARQAELSAAQARRVRLIRLGTLVLVAALVIVVIAVAVGGGNGGPKAVGSKTAKAKVAALLHGIPQTASVAGGIQLGNPKAPVTITEYGDLVCPICQEFAVGDEEQIIKNYVRTGKAQIIFRADETASATANNGEFSAGQVAARSAALQKLGWNYIYTWYEEQQSEDTPYVTDAFLQGLAKQIPGLNYGKWHTQLQNPNLAGYVTVDERAMNSLASSLPQGNATPTVIIKGPKGSAPPIQGLAPYSTFQTYIKGVS